MTPHPHFAPMHLDPKQVIFLFVAAAIIVPVYVIPDIYVSSPRLRSRMR